VQWHLMFMFNKGILYYLFPFFVQLIAFDVTFSFVCGLKSKLDSIATGVGVLNR